MQAFYYLPVEIIFNILCYYRMGKDNNPRSLRSALQRRGLHSLTVTEGNLKWHLPRLSFWVRLCQEASLLDDGPDPYPTLLADEWLTWPFQEQIIHLVKAWARIPKTEKSRRFRADILRRLREGAELSISHRKELLGLYFLGVCEGGRLTETGLELFSRIPPGKLTVCLPERWQIEMLPVSRYSAGSTAWKLNVPFPPNWSLLWQLERFLDPVAAGVPDKYICYLLDEKTLRLAAQRGAQDGSPSLPEILERGLGKTPPTDLVRSLTQEPVIRLVSGLVLEFTHPDELKQLRQSPGLRKELDLLLSPRHVVLDAWRGHRVLQSLYRKGLLSEKDLISIQQTRCANSVVSQPERIRIPNQFSKSERAYLLSLMLLAEGLQKTIAPPPGLLTRLTDGIDHSLRAAAARKATQALKQIVPQPAWQPDDELPPVLPEILVEQLQAAIDRGESVDVLYQASGRHSAEYRHLTPLLLEERGSRFYLVAYCHTRRANRTFRLDRLKLWVN